MPNDCSIATCSNSTRKTGKDISYFSFPKDPHVRKSWIKACRRGDKINPDNARICGAHFSSDDYVRDLKAELLGYVPPRKLLKKDVVPTLNLPTHVSGAMRNSSADRSVLAVNGSEKNAQESFPNSRSAGGPLSAAVLRQKRFQRREIRKRLMERLKKLPLRQTKIDAATNTEGRPPCDECANRIQAVQMMKKEMKSLRLRVKAADALREKRRKLQMEVHLLQTTLKKMEIVRSTELQCAVEKVCGKVFTKTQINCLLRGRRTGCWTDEDMMKAFEFWSISPRAYRYRRKQGEPLPCRSTLLRWKKSLTCQPSDSNAKCFTNL